VPAGDAAYLDGRVEDRDDEIVIDNDLTPGYIPIGGRKIERLTIYKVWQALDGL